MFSHSRRLVHPSSNRTAKFTSSKNNQYVLACASDLNGVGDIGNAQAQSMSDCINACDTKPSCNAAAYWASTNMCYFKGISNGRALDLAPSAWADFFYSASLTSCSALSSANLRLQYTNTRQYDFSCHTDLPWVGDIISTPGGSVIDCIKSCDANVQCTTAYFEDSASTCWMKSITGRAINPVVNPGNGTLIYLSSMSTCKSLAAGGRRVLTLNQRDYSLQCGADAPGQGALEQIQSASMMECINACDAQSGCNAVIYAEATQACFLKGLGQTANIVLSNGGDLAALTSLGIGTALPAKDQTGAWGSLMKFPLVPVSAAPVPNTNNVFVWSADFVDSFTINDAANQLTQFATMDITSGKVSQLTVSNTGHDMFCPGISFDVKGRLIVTGGFTQSAVSIFDPSTNSWSRVADMNLPRGYHASSVTSNGKVFVLGGSFVGGLGGKIGELYDPTANTWTRLPGCVTDPMVTNDNRGIYRADNHAWLFPWKNGNIFQAGPSKSMNWFSTSGTGIYQSAGTRANANDSMCGNAVMYDAVNGKILTMGGSTSYDNSMGQTSAHLITLGNAKSNPQTQQVSSMAYGRAFANAVAIPNGEVFVTGGQFFSIPFSDAQSSLYSEMWSPTTQSFRTLEAMNPAPRNYHSVAVLLADGTVFTGGGGLCGTCTTNRKDVAIYTPPYLYKGNTLATRPVITSVSTSSFVAGTKFSVHVTWKYASAPTFALVRAGSTTHSVNTDQRRVLLTPISSANGVFTLQLPSYYGILPPGWYYLFAMDNGVPSIAKWVQVNLS